MASGPPLQDDLTEIDYSLTVEGKPWTGTLHVPRGGTKAIDDDAKAAAQLTVPAGKKGPNGGVIQYIGGQPVEMVADSNSREVRLYVLDSNYAVMDPGERTFRLGYAADYSGMQVLVREPGMNYYVGPWYAGYNPYRITVAMGYGGEVHVGILGWRYGESLRWGVYAPFAFVGVYNWAPSFSVGSGWGGGWGWGGGGWARGGREFGGRGHWDRDHGHGDRDHGHGRGGDRDHGRGHGDGDHGHAGGHGDPGGGHGSGHGPAEHGGSGHGTGEPVSRGGEHRNIEPGGGVHTPAAGGRGAPAGGGRAAPARAAPRPSSGGTKRR